MYTVQRNGVQHNLAAAFVRPTDLVWTTDREWLVATMCHPFASVFATLRAPTVVAAKPALFRVLPVKPLAPTHRTPSNVQLNSQLTPTFVAVLRPAVSPTPPEPALVTIMKGAGVAALATASAMALFKVVQAIVDEDLGDGPFPKWFRDEKIQAHVDQHGWVCLHCDCRVPKGTLTVDHIRARKNGGRTSRLNAQIMCLWCNSSKGAKNTLTDLFIGRGR